MATRASQTSQNRQGAYGNGNSGAGGMDVGAVAINRMAREDARWFAIAVVVLSLVLFLALPLSVLVMIDTMKMKTEIRQEMKQIKKLQQELKRKTDE